MNLKPLTLTIVLATVLAINLLLGLIISEIPYFNLKKHEFITALYLLSVYFVTYKFKVPLLPIVFVLTVIAFILTILQFTFIAEMLGNVIFLSMVLLVIKQLFRMRSEN